MNECNDDKFISGMNILLDCCLFSQIATHCS